MYHRRDRQPTSCTKIPPTLLYIARKACEPTQHTSNVFKRVLLLLPMYSELLSLSTKDVFESDKPDQFSQTIYLYNSEDSTMATDPHHHCKIYVGSHFDVNNYTKHY